jgi:hypothetical protein
VLEKADVGRECGHAGFPLWRYVSTFLPGKKLRLRIPKRSKGAHQNHQDSRYDYNA